jgi:hypothetical protein
MATVEECRQALDTLAARMARHAAELSGKVNLDRRMVCHLRDLDTSFQARLHDGTITDIEPGDDPKAKIRLDVGSDDLVAMVGGQLDFAKAWASGKLSVKASVLDLLKLRTLM